MRILDILKPGRSASLLYAIGSSIISVYIYSMIVWPWLSGRGNWDYIQEVWDRWQSLNVGILAFASSILAFSIAKYNAEKQRERDFLAARALLPAALSELISYFKDSARVFNCDLGPETTPPSVPNLPAEYKDIFKDCIRHADPMAGDYLCRILVLLQIHDSRMRSYVNNQQNENNPNSDRKRYFYGLGEIQALTDKLFNFARNMEKLDSSPLTWSDFNNAYINLGISPRYKSAENETNLECHTKINIDKNTHKCTYRELGS